MTRFDMVCPTCSYQQEIQGHVGQLPQCHCPRCNTPMRQSFRGRSTVLMNMGFRPERYSNETDRNIAQYQFEHL